MRHFLLIVLLSLSYALSAQCLVSAELTNTTCFEDISRYTADFTVQAANPGTTGFFEVTDIDGNSFGFGQYPGDITVSSFLIGQDILLLFADTSSTGCADTFQLVSPDCFFSDCEITAEAVFVQCDTVEDAFFLDIHVSNVNDQLLTGWLAYDEEGARFAEGSYDSITTFGPFPANGNVEITFRDNVLTDCVFFFEAQAPDCGITACEIDIDFLENECTTDGSGFFYRFTVTSTEDANWTAPQFGGMGGQTNTGQIFRAGPYTADRSGQVTVRLTENSGCSVTRNLPAATCPEFPCFGFSLNAGPSSPTFCESGDVWEFEPVNGTYPMSIEIFTVAGNFRVVSDSLFAPGSYADFLDQGEYRVVVTDANECTVEETFFVEANFCSSVQGRSWLDLNGNGIQDVDETVGVPAEVFLVNTIDNSIQATISDPNGLYIFSNVLAGSYQLQFLPLQQQQLTATTPGIGNDDCADSDVQPGDWITLPFQVGSGEQVTCFDAGWIEADCDSLFLTAQADPATGTCGDIPDILVNYSSETFPAEISLVGPGGNVLQVLTFEEAGEIVFTTEIAGDYVVRISTANGCFNAVQVPVEEVQGLEVLIEQTGNICNDDDPAVLTAIVPGIDPASLVYEWSTGETTSSISDLTLSSIYFVTVTGVEDGCTGTDFFRVLPNPEDSLGFITFEEPFVIGCESDSVFISVDSVREGYEYRWFGPLNQIFDGPGFWATVAGLYYLEAFSENGCSISGAAEVVNGSLEEIIPTLVVFPNDSICAGHNCIQLFWEGPFFGNFPPGVEVLWETPTAEGDVIANLNPFNTYCTPYPGLHRVTITTECDTLIRSVVLDDPRGCSSLSGRLWLDQGGDCGLDAEDTSVPNYVVMLTNDATGEIYYTITDANGFWQLEVPEGTYTIVPSLAPGSPFGTCDPAVSVTLGSSPVEGINVLLPAIASCPQLTTTVAMPFLRRCFNNTLWVEYENRGTATAIDAQVTVILDDFFEDVSVVPAPVSQDGQVYTFNVGDLDPFQRGLIFFQVKVSCDAQLGQNHCVEVSITPDAPCDPDPAWDGALVNVDAVGCDGDSVLFRISNIGLEQMSVPLSYVIVEDGIMLSPQPFINGQLIPDEVMEIMLPANGSTYHIITNQEPNAPANPEPTAVLEGCNVAGNNGFSTGFGNILNLANGPLTTTTVCRENQGAYDPNDKHGYPLGYGNEDYIPEGTRLDYAIRFQNTGTDTAFTVIIRDTIPESLDLATLKMDASSHPYTVTLDTHRVLSFVFENILLPDSSTNLAGSQGVVNFSIDHATDLRPGDEILNEAAIFFDFNEPIITNLSRHTIEKDGLPTGTRNQFAQQVAVGIFPNPANGRINVRIPDQRIQATDLLLITDLYGRQLAKTNYATAANGWNIDHLPAGYYLVVVTDNQGSAIGRAGFVVSN